MVEKRGTREVSGSTVLTGSLTREWDEINQGYQSTGLPPKQDSLNIPERKVLGGHPNFRLISLNSLIKGSG